MYSVLSCLFFFLMLLLSTRCLPHWCLLGCLCDVNGVSEKCLWQGDWRSLWRPVLKHGPLWLAAAFFFFFFLWGGGEVGVLCAANERNISLFFSDTPSDSVFIHRMLNLIRQIFRYNLIILKPFFLLFFCIKTTWLSCLLYCTAPVQRDSASTFSCYKTVPLQYSALQIWLSGCTEREVRQLYFVSLSKLKWCPSQGKQHHLWGCNYAAILQHSREAACRPRCSLCISILLKPPDIHKKALQTCKLDTLKWGQKFSF